MIIEEAEKKYGKEMTIEIWDHFDLSKIKIDDTPEGLNVPDYEWETIYNSIKQKDL